MKRWIYLLAVPFLVWSCADNEQSAISDFNNCFDSSLEQAGFDLDEMITAFDAYYIEQEYIADNKASSYLGVLEYLEFNPGENPTFEAAYKAPASEFLFDDIDVCVQKIQELHSESISASAHLQRICAIFEMLRSGDIIMDDLLIALREALAEAPDDDKMSKALTILFTTIV